jgi:beta-phosphoglucomutase
MASTTRQRQTWLRRGVRGLLLDMDGTLFDSEVLHIQAWRQVLESLGAVYPDAWYQPWIGTPDRELPAAVLAERPELGIGPEAMLERKAAVYGELARRELKPFAGLEARLRGLAAEGAPMVVCTSSRRLDAELSLTAGGLADLFPLRVALEDAPAPKPDPSPYRNAAGLIGLDPAECLAIEDSPAGVASATGAGCLVAAVTTTHPASALARARHLFEGTPAALDWLDEDTEADEEAAAL